ncbi:Transposase, Ptta/En/Spm, plant, partial [Corchorus capsularis]
QLKKTIKNKSAVEGSICEAYIAYEINTFSQHYFELDVRCTSRRPRRNDEVVNDPSKPPFSIFNYPGRFHGRPRVRMLNDEERKVAHTYVLRNCLEVDPYLEMFVDYLKHEGSDEIDQRIEMFFADWFKLYVYYTWPKSREKEVRGEFGKLASEHIRREFRTARKTLGIPNPGWIPDAAWDIIRAYWRSPQFRALQEQNQHNCNTDGFASTSGYRGGHISTYTYRQRLAIEKGQKPKRVEIYERTHGRKDKSGSYPPSRTTITMDNEATKAKQIQSDQKLDKLQEYLQTMCAALAQQNIHFPPPRILEQVSESSGTTRHQPQQPEPVENPPNKDDNNQEEDLEAHDQEFCLW